MKSLYLLLVSLGATHALPPTKSTNCIDKCTCTDPLPNILEVVKCDGSLTIDDTIFKHLDSRIVTVMSFSNVIINQIKEDAFKRFSNLQDVIVEKAQIGSVDQKAFDNVKRLKFADCSFEDSPNLYSQKLEELHFGNCKLDVIPAMETLFSLKFLNLSGNYITEIDIMSFTELFSLETLILSNNEISRIPGDLFINNKDLNSLYLDNNPLKVFHLNVSNKLETLSLKNCFLSTFDERSGGSLFSLSELDLSNNRLSSLSSKDLTSLQQLAVIDLSNNSLTELHDDVFSHNSKLLKVTLDGNKIKTLPNFTLINEKENFQIYAFSCKNCDLKMIHPDVFRNMPAVISLNLAQNKLTYVGATFKYISSLRILDISGNDISVLSEAFEANRNLESLNLAGNPLGSVNPEDFIQNRAIKTINVSNCHLEKLWSSKTGVVLSSLRKLFLANNLLRTLNASDLEVVPQLHALDLHNNPLEFDEGLCRVFDLLEKRYIYLIEYSQHTEGPLSDDIDNLVSSGNWSMLQKNNCPKILNATESDNNINYYVNDELEDDNVNNVNDNDVGGDDDIDDDDDEDDDYSYPEEYDDYGNKEEGIVDKISEGAEKEPTLEIIEEGENINLAKVSYILSVTSVFVLTALAVLIMAVVVTLCVLKRNNNFDMRRANLPRIKIPRWESQFAAKKHSGQIYRPLSEDLSVGPATPKMSRYDFSASPTVHSINS